MRCKGTWKWWRKGGNLDRTQVSIATRLLELVPTLWFHGTAQLGTLEEGGDSPDFSLVLSSSITSLDGECLPVSRVVEDQNWAMWGLSAKSAGTAM